MVRKALLRTAALGVRNQGESEPRGELVLISEYSRGGWASQPRSNVRGQWKGSY